MSTVQVFATCFCAFRFAPFRKKPRYKKLPVTWAVGKQIGFMPRFTVSTTILLIAILGADKLTPHLPVFEP
jgi:hypothetical protein